MTPKTTYTFDYPQAIEFAQTQRSVYWEPTEIQTEKDVQDLMVTLSPSERHGIITTLKLFTLYEIEIGTEYWGGIVTKLFPRPDIQQMANCFSFFEINVHAPFYNQINEAMMLNTDDFYESYVDDPALANRMEFIEEAAASKDRMHSLGVFSMMEGAVLYSSFAFIKHFQSRGKNTMTNICAGINFSVRDENLHHEGGAWLFRTALAELDPTHDELMELHDKIIESAKHIREHEYRIIDMIFEKGKIPGITSLQMKNFIDSRINLCLSNLGIGRIKEFEVDYNPIADWFYDGINMIQFGDIFNAKGNEYHRSWDEEGFSW
tara:strand:+ start:1162 stop:2121 length:960 start_codon:yes stop_codon:yes gene_type:complete